MMKMSYQIIWPLFVACAAGCAGAADVKADDEADAGVQQSGLATIRTAIPTATGTEIRASTTVLPRGDHGFNNKRIGVQNPIGCEGEGQPAVFELADGAVLHDVIIAGGTPGGNGVICKGSCTLYNVYWEDVCEDAATLTKDGSTMILDNVIAKSAADKLFQHNGKGGSKMIITNSYLSTFGKAWRSCGDCSKNGGPRYLDMNNVKVESVSVTVAAANENYGDNAKIRNLFVKGGYKAASDSPKICQLYKGVSSGSSPKLYGGASQWSTASCNVAKTDVLSW